MSALAIVRIERKQASGLSQRLVAQTHARSAVEYALRNIANDSSWRTTYTNDVATTPVGLGPNSTGTMCWMLRDADGSLADADRDLWLKGIGRVGDCVQVSSVKIAAGETSSTLRSHSVVLDLGATQEDVRSTRWWGQYFKPQLPATANGWRITQVDLRIRRIDSNRSFRVRLYAAGSNFLPNGTVIESVDISSNSVSGTLQWFSVPLAGTTSMNNGDAVILAIETVSSGTPVRITHAGGVSGGNSGLMRGDPDWQTFDTSRALQYRVLGSYTSNGEVTAVAGSWIWDAAP
jgi:hypothetical protein